MSMFHDLQKYLIENGHHYSETVVQSFLQYLELLERWNQKYNLTAIQPPQERITHHILDSLAILPYVQGKRIIDVGSGAGLPGLILAIARPDLEFFLLDSNGKKTRFLTQVVFSLALKNVTVVHRRVEQFHPDFCFDQIVTRAFSSLENMLKCTHSLLCPDGEFLAMKGIYPEAEIKAILPPFKVIAVHPLKIKGLNEQRCVVVIKYGSNQ